MRGGGRTFLTAMAAAVLVTALAQTPPASRAATPGLDALRTRRAALESQLAQLVPNRNDASRALVSAQAALSASQDRILATEREQRSLNQSLLGLSSAIASDQDASRRARRELAGMTRAAYESSSDNAFMDSLLAAGSVGDAVERLKAEQHVSTKVTDLVQRVNDKDRSVLRERADLQDRFARASALEDQLGVENGRMVQLVAARDASFAQANGPVQSLVRQIHDLDQQIAAAAQGVTDAVVGPITGGTCGNHFAFGQCTYYVATRRCIPWTGNARDWFANAARMGYSEGHTPAVGAVVAFRPGGDGASWAGHVGYVEAVGPAGGVPAGSFRISEMNFAGWDRVSYRTLPNNSGGIQGFIYGHP